MVIILDNGSLERPRMSVIQVQVDYQTKELYMVVKFLNIVFYWKILFCKRRYSYRVLKHVRLL